ncbi:MAG: hypothetical protein JW797_00105 [Bradymonadales bacterium]|nr:hypothetical protein [Bradymonadales bacterium]
MSTARHGGVGNGRRSRIGAAVWIHCGLLFSLLLTVFTACAIRLDRSALFSDEPGGVPDSNPLAFSAVDIYGRPFQVGYPSEQIWVVFFNGMDTNDPMEPVTSEMAIRYRSAENVFFLNIFDLRSLAFYERPFAEGVMRSRGRATVDRVNAMLAEMGLSIEGDMHDHMYVWSDDGELIDRYQVPDPNRTITCIVFSTTGREVGRFDPVEGMEPIFVAIDRNSGSH